MMDHGLDAAISGTRDTHDEDNNINISDVIEVIQTTDPDFNQTGMFSGGGEVTTAPGPSATVQRGGGGARRGAYVKILEQPASKALRFRYECEGRSAGSIPGASSTPENKTFPAIQVVGYQGRAVVVVSCVTKDPPYRPHPHNLVGREGCRRGVCTLEVSPESMAVTFSNLGIQCVKKKDIEDALKVREEIRVDPFRTGFAHRNQPTSIDLNAVRLCFQVFLEGDSRGKFTVPLNPVVSDPIYDKKAMSDLVICKLSDCTCTVAGGKEIILLCEKVAKEDIQVRFYEESNGAVLWEGLGDFQPTHVHKQVAISFRTPRYRTLEVSDPVKVYIQLRRPSDGATSESLPFEFLPLDSGRPAFWSLRRTLQKKGDYNTFNSILAADHLSVHKNASIRPKPLKIQNGSNPLFQAEHKIDEIEIVDSPTKTQLLETNLDEASEEVAASPETSPTIVAVVEKKKDWCDYSEVEKISNTQDSKDILNNNNNIEEKSLNDLLNQVAELDEIYSDTRTRLLDITDAINDDINHSEELQSQPMEIEAFDDSNTYSSLQLAFKNPIDIELPSRYDEILTVQGPVIEIAPLKRENESEKLPPLPPKRIRKSIETPILGRATSQNSIQLTNSQAGALLHTSSPNLVSTPVSRSTSFNNITRPKSQELIAPSKKLPPTPCSTLPNPKKQSFFSKLFSKKTKKDKSPSKNSSLTNLNTQSQTIKAGSASLGGGSLCNISNSNNNDASIIHISLHPTPTGSMSDFTKMQNDLNATNNKVNGNLKDVDVINLDLTEAEHYALYTAMAPHATQSEFDEMSCYYSPVEGGKILNTQTDGTTKLKNPVNLKRKRQKFGNDPNNHVLRHLQEHEQARNLHSQLNIINIPAEASVKIEPRDTSPSPYGGQMYGSGLSPMYIPQGGTSPQPQYLFPVENLPGRTPSPMETQNYNFPPSNYANITPPLNIQQAQATPNISPAPLPSNVNMPMSHMSAGLSNYMVAQQSWNVANVVDEAAASGYTTGADAANGVKGGDAPTGLSSVLDLDSKELTQLNSADFDGLNLFDANLSENLSNNLSLSDIKTDMFKQDDVAQENMTDSFTRLTTATIDNICNLNNLYKPNIKD